MNAGVRVVFAVVDRDGQFARDPKMERPDGRYVTLALDRETAARDMAHWDATCAAHAPHVVRVLTWGDP